MTVTAALSERTALYSNLSLLELIDEYATGRLGATELPGSIPGLSPAALEYLRTWEGRAQAAVWLSVATPTLGALRRFRNLDTHDRQTVDRAYVKDVRRAARASQIALDSFTERMEFLAAQASSAGLQSR